MSRSWRSSPRPRARRRAEALPREGGRGRRRGAGHRREGVDPDVPAQINAIKVKGSVVYRDFVELPDRFRRETEFEGETLVKRTTCVIVGDKGWGKAEEGIAAGEVVAAGSRRDRQHQVEGPELRRHRPADPAPPGGQGVPARRVEDRRPGRRRRAGRPHRPGRRLGRRGCTTTRSPAAWSATRWWTRPARR